MTRTSGGTVATGGGNFTVPAGALPLDNSFKDTRYAGSVDWQRPIGRLGLVSFGGSLSTEHDYDHLGVDAHVAHDFNSRNTTLSAGVEWSDDSVTPIGGSPIPFTALSLNAASVDGSRAKHVRDALLGVTQVFSATHDRAAEFFDQSLGRLSDRSVQSALGRGSRSRAI